VPCFNEGTVIRDHLSELVNSGFQVIAVNDGSTDSTGIQARIPGVVLISHPINLGQGAAIETGLEYLRRNLDLYEIAVTFDADGQHKVSDVFMLIKTLEEKNVNVVLGNRFVGNHFQGGRLKGFLIQLSAFVGQFTLGIHVGDRHNGLRAFDVEAIKQIRIQDSGFGHADEVLRIIIEKNLSYCEAPVTLIYSEYSKSKGQPLYNLVNLLFDKLFRKI